MSGLDDLRKYIDTLSTTHRFIHDRYTKDTVLITYGDPELERIADRIEAECYSERTCHDIAQGGGVFMCSFCGAFTKHGAVMDCCDSIPQRYCPNCGARVVGDE